MKKRLLLVLTIVMLMCVAAFSTNAVCAEGKHRIATRTVNATCSAGGYTEIYCSICGVTFEKKNETAPIPHAGKESYVESGDHFIKKIECQLGCGQTVTEQENGADVVYYRVRFFNGHAIDERLMKDTVNGKTVTFKHTEIAKSTKDVQLSEVMVKKGDSVKYTATCPERVKDKENSAFIFRGWVKAKNAPFNYIEKTDYDKEFKNSDDYVTCTRYTYTKIKITDVNANTDYFAAWEGQQATYQVKFTYHGGDYLVESVKHGQPAYFPYAYPENYVDSGYDYIFIGWGKGDPGKKDTSGNYTKYDEYLDKDIHISKVPVYSSDDIQAVYNRVPRIYKVNFKANDKVHKLNIPYGSDLGVEKVSNGFTFKVGDEIVTFAEKVYKDDYVYYYEKSNGFIFDNGDDVKGDYFILPPSALDHDDLVYIKFETGANKGQFFKVGNDKVILFNVNGDNSMTFFDYYNEEVRHYNNCRSTNTVYSPLYFDIEKTGSYFYLESEHGQKVLDNNGKAVTFRAEWQGTFTTMPNETEKAFTPEYAESLRSTNVSPYYYRTITNHKMIVEVIMPVEIDGVSKELMYESYANQLSVQVSDKNGQHVASGVTGNGGTAYAPVLKKEGGNQYYYMYCVLDVPQLDQYQITVAATKAMNGKYEGSRVISWDQFKNYNYGKVRVDVDVADGYNQDVKCSCLCHSMFSGVWATVLNLLNSLFKYKHVCCPHMFEEIGHLLKYTK